MKRLMAPKGAADIQVLTVETIGHEREGPGTNATLKRALIPISAEDAGSIWKVTPTGALSPGKYAISAKTIVATYCFGIEP